jgi:hypothetical protein
LHTCPSSRWRFWSPLRSWPRRPGRRAMAEATPGGTGSPGRRDAMGDHPCDPRLALPFSAVDQASAVSRSCYGQPWSRCCSVRRSARAGGPRLRAAEGQFARPPRRRAERRRAATAAGRKPRTTSVTRRCARATQPGGSTLAGARVRPMSCSAYGRRAWWLILVRFDTQAPLRWTLAGVFAAAAVACTAFVLRPAVKRPSPRLLAQAQRLRLSTTLGGVRSLLARAGADGCRAREAGRVRLRTRHVAVSPPVSARPAQPGRARGRRADDVKLPAGCV